MRLAVRDDGFPDLSDAVVARADVAPVAGPVCALQHLVAGVAGHGVVRTPALQASAAEVGHLYIYDTR